MNVYQNPIKELLLSAIIACAAVPPLVNSALAQTVGPNINLTKAAGNQYETSVAVNPNDKNQILVVGRNETGGLATARSSDGGITWTSRIIGTSPTPTPGDIPRAYGNASVAWDSFGNLFLAYLSQSSPTTQALYVTVAVSTDGGTSFYAPTGAGPAIIIPPNGTGYSTGDQPTITVGPGSGGFPGSAWVTYFSFGGIWVSGAGVSGLGAVGPFTSQPLPSQPTGVNFGDIAVGPNGEVMVTYGPNSGAGGTIYTNSDPDGLGPAPFSSYAKVVAINIGGFTYIPAQPNWGIGPEVGLVYDRSNGPHRGRAYIVYTDAPAVGSNDTNIFVVYSDNKGATWSTPVRVNDDTGTNSQFLPHISLDNSNGMIAVTWYDARNSAANNTAQYVGAFSADGGASFGPDFQISTGTSNQANSIAAKRKADYGDYTGNSFVTGRLVPAWADNSNSTGDNPDGATNFDVYTAIVQAPDYAPNQYYLPHVATGNFGTISFRTTFILFNNSSTSITAILSLTDDSGNPLTVSIRGFGTGSQFVINLDSGCSGFLQTDGLGSGIAGAAKIAATGPIGVSGIFTVYDANGNYLTEAGVGAADLLTQFVLPVDSTGSFLTGLALYSPGVDASITMTLINTDGSQAGTAVRQLKNGNHSAVFLAAAGQQFSTISNFQGTLLVQSTSPVAALVLRQYQTPSMFSYTSLPVVPKTSTKLALNLAHIANGSYGNISFKTSFVIFNMSSSPANVVLALTQDNGSPFTVTIPGSGPGTGTNDSFTFTLGAGASVFLQTDGLGAGTSGAATVTSNVPVGASAVFTVLNAQGQFQTEAGVGDSPALGTMTIPVDVTRNFDTGVAFFNPGGTPLTLTFKILDANGVPGSSVTRSLASKNHLATFVDNLFPGLVNFRGSLAVSSTGSVAGTVLRQYASGATYTTMPAVSGAAAGAVQPAPLLTKVATGIDAVETVVPYSATLSPGSTISGTVSGAAHAITVVATAGGSQSFTSRANPLTGRYLIVAPDGIYGLTAYYQPDSISNSMAVTLAYSDPSPVQLASSAVRNIVLPAVTLANVSGIVSGLGALPSGISNRIDFTSSDNTVQGQFALDANGRYQGLLPAGTYIVCVGNGNLQVFNLGSLTVSGAAATGNYAVPPLVRLSGVISGGSLTNNMPGTIVAAADTSAPAATQSFCCTPHSVSYAVPDTSGRYQIILAQNRNYAVHAAIAADYGTGMSGSIIYPLTPITMSMAGDSTLDISIPPVIGGRVQFYGTADDGIRVLTGVIVNASSQSIVGAANLGLSVSTTANGLYSLYTPFGSNYQLTFVPPAPKP